MNFLIKTLAVAAAGAVLATGSFAQSAAPFLLPAAPFLLPLENEAAPNLIVEPPLPGPLARGLVFIPYRVENVRILPVSGASARALSPRVGHLHITVDDLPWQWVEFGDSNTFAVAGMPPGPHKLLIQLVDPVGTVFAAETVPFIVPRSNP
jgi:hypothetical protein